MVLEHKLCIQKWKFLILCSNTYYKRPEVQADKGNLFTFPCLFEPNDFQFAPNETHYAPNEIQLAQNETH